MGKNLARKYQSLEKRPHGPHVGCKPSREIFFEIQILSSSDSVFSPDSEFGFRLYRQIRIRMNTPVSVYFIGQKAFVCIMHTSLFT